jgi:hypothetical protein
MCCWQAACHKAVASAGGVTHCRPHAPPHPLCAASGMEALLGRAAARIWHEATFSKQEQERQAEQHRQQLLQQMDYQQPPQAAGPEQEQQLASRLPLQSAGSVPQASPAAADAALGDALAAGAEQVGSAKTRWLSRSRVTADDILAKPAQVALFPSTQQQAAAAAAATAAGRPNCFRPMARTGSGASSFSHTSLPAIPETGPIRKPAASVPMATPSKLPCAGQSGQGVHHPAAGHPVDDREVTKVVLAELGQSDPANVSWRLLAEVSRRADLAELLADVRQAALGRRGRGRRLNGKQCRCITHALNRRLLGGASRPGLTGSESTKHHQHAQHHQQEQEQEGEGCGLAPRRISCAESGTNGGGTTEDEDDARTEVSSEWKSSIADLPELQDSGSVASLGTASLGTVGSVADYGYDGGEEGEWAEEGRAEARGGWRLVLRAGAAGWCCGLVLRAGAAGWCWRSNGWCWWLHWRAMHCAARLAALHRRCM